MNKLLLTLVLSCLLLHLGHKYHWKTISSKKCQCILPNIYILAGNATLNRGILPLEV